MTSVARLLPQCDSDVYHKDSLDAHLQNFNRKAQTAKRET